MQQEVELQVLDYAPSGMCVIGEDLSIVFWNKCLEEWSNLKRSEVIGRKLTDVYSNLAHPKYSKRFEIILQGGAPAVFSSQLHKHFFTVPYTSTQLRVFHTVVSHLTIKSQNSKFALICLQDVTDLTNSVSQYKKMREEAQRAVNVTTHLTESNQELEQFALIVSHDLKAPLRTISNLADWVIEDADGSLPVDSQEHMQRIHLSAKKMQGLLDELIQYARVGREKMPSEVLDLNALVSEIIDLLQPTSDLLVKIVSSLPVIQSPKAPLSLVFRNLIGYALEHNDSTGGAIEISAQERENEIEFSVKGNGLAIPKKRQDKLSKILLTQKFPESIEDVGTGLPIVKKTLEQHGGHISFEPNKGVGTTFRFTWPK